MRSAPAVLRRCRVVCRLRRSRSNGLLWVVRQLDDKRILTQRILTQRPMARGQPADRWCRRRGRACLRETNSVACVRWACARGARALWACAINKYKFHVSSLEGAPCARIPSSIAHAIVPTLFSAATCSLMPIASSSLVRLPLRRTARAGSIELSRTIDRSSRGTGSRPRRAHSTPVRALHPTQSA